MDRAALDELLRRAARHESGALAQLVDAYSPRVFGLLFRLTGSRDAAEDLTQETFLRVVRTIAEYEHAGRFEPWLFRIAANLARDRARKRGRRGESAALDAVADELTAAAPDRDPAGVDPAATLLRQEAGSQLAAAVARLAPAEQEILLLRHYGELSFREIADLLKIPLGTALARAHRALQRLKRELADEDAT